MFRKFEILCSISLLHDYYADGKSRDFRILPTPSCLKVLQAHKLLFRQMGNRGLVIFARTKENLEGRGRVLREIRDEVVLTFQLALTRPDFYNYTDLGESRPPAPRHVFCFSNIDPANGRADEHLDAEGNILLTRSAQAGWDDRCPLVSNRFRVPADGTLYRAVEIQKPVIGNGPQAILEETLGEYQQSLFIESTIRDSGQYLVNRTPRTASNLSSEDNAYNVWIDPQLRQQDIFGLIEIHLNDSNVDYDTPREYAIAFQRKESIWNYYFVFDNEEVIDDEELGRYAMIYNRDSNEHAELYPANIAFQRLSPVAGQHDEELSIIESYQPKQALLFQSTEAIPFLEQKLDGLQLIKTGIGTPELVFGRLPNPSVRLFKPNVITHLKN